MNALTTYAQTTAAKLFYIKLRYFEHRISNINANTNIAMFYRTCHYFVVVSFMS